MSPLNRVEADADAIPLQKTDQVQRTARTCPGALQTVLDSMRARSGFPGATAAYVSADGASGAVATGWADVEAGRPMPPDARMLAASIGKSFVAATAVALAEEGTLDLDMPIGRWLGDRSWFRDLPNGDRITLRHLLTHRSGLPDHVHTDAFAKAVARRWQEPENAFPPDTLIQFVVGRPALFEPGAGWAYSDTGYLLAGLILEETTGRSYYDLVQERFLTPLGLEHTRPDPAEHADRAHPPGRFHRSIRGSIPPRYAFPVRPLLRTGTGGCPQPRKRHRNPIGNDTSSATACPRRRPPILQRCPSERRHHPPGVVRTRQCLRFWGGRGGESVPGRPGPGQATPSPKESASVTASCFRRKSGSAGIQPSRARRKWSRAASSWPRSARNRA